MAFCSQCGGALPEGARFCPHCGSDANGSAEPRPAADPRSFAAAQPASGPVPPPTRGRGRGFILPMVIVLAIAVIGILLWSQRDGTRPIAGGPGNDSAQAEGREPEARGGEDADAAETADAPSTASGDTIRTTAASLDSAFNSDPQGARARYAGPVTVSGTIATMVTPGSTPSLSLEGRTRFNFVVANFPAGSRTQLAELSKGDRITIACDRVAALAGTTILQGCALE